MLSPREAILTGIQMWMPSSSRKLLLVQESTAQCPPLRHSSRRQSFPRDAVWVREARIVDEPNLPSVLVAHHEPIFLWIVVRVTLTHP